MQWHWEQFFSFNGMVLFRVVLIVDIFCCIKFTIFWVFVQHANWVSTRYILFCLYHRKLQRKPRSVVKVSWSILSLNTKVTTSTPPLLFTANLRRYVKRYIKFWRILGIMGPNSFQFNLCVKLKKPLYGKWHVLFYKFEFQIG